MSQDITLLGASYSDVPAVELPKTGGGTASFTDVTDTTAVAGDVMQGKYFFTANGVLTLGTNQGGSGDGYVWQDGNGYVHLSDEEGTLPIIDSLTVSASGTYNAPTGHVYNPVIVPSGTEGTPTATKGAVNNHSISVTPSVTNTAGYISGSTKTGTAVSVSASELVSGTYTVDSSGTKDVTNYASASIGALTLPSALTNSVTGTKVATLNLPNGVNKYLQIPKGYNNTSSYYQLDVPSGSATPASTISATGATVTTGTNTLTLSKSVSNTPTVSAGYVSSGTAGNSSVSLTASVNTRTSSDLTASGATVTAPAGYYASSASKSVSSMTLPNSTSNSYSGTYKAAIKSDTSGITYLNIPTGYNSTAQHYQIEPFALDSLPITSNGTYTATDYDLDGFDSVTVNVSGGGSSYTPISVGDLEVTANITSTSVTTITTSLTIDTSALSSSKMLYVKVRDKAGKRNGYFYGTDLFFPIWDYVGGGTTQNPAKQVYRVNTSGNVQSYTPATTTCYGVYVSGVTDTGAVYVMGRYSSSYSLTIDGTYSIDIYMLEWPNNVSPMI